MKVAVLHNLVGGAGHRRLMEQVARLDDVVEITTATAQPVTMRPVVVPLRPLARAVLPLLRPPLRYRDLTEVGKAWRRMGELAQASGADVVLAEEDRLLSGAVDPGPWSVPVVRFCAGPRRIDHEPHLAATRNPATRVLYRDLYRRETELDRAAIRGAQILLTGSAAAAEKLRLAYGRAAEVVPTGPDWARSTAELERHLLRATGREVPPSGLPRPSEPLDEVPVEEISVQEPPTPGLVR